MRPLYFVPDRISPLLSDAGNGPVYFSTAPYESEDLSLRILCGRACILLARGMDWAALCRTMQIEDIDYFESCFKEYNGLSPDEYRRWALSL